MARTSFPDATLPTATRGFSLFEIAMVLSVLGLLVGGIIGGKAMIHAAELRSILQQHKHFLTATQNFEEKYANFPGDMPNATEYWGLAGGANGSTPECAAVESTSAATCNGDGDGLVLSDPPGPEPTRFWQHLANAGYIEGRYSGTYDATASLSKGNAPAGKVAHSLWGVQYIGNLSGGVMSGDTNFFDGVYGNSLMFGGFDSSKFYPNVGVITTDDIRSLDTKMDDGKPGGGKLVVAAILGFSDCTDGATSADTSANYSSGSPITTCTMIFRQQF